MKTRVPELSSGFLIFYYLSALIGTLSTLFWVEKLLRQGLEISSTGRAIFVLWDLIELILTISAWLIPYVTSRKKVSVLVIRLVPSLLISSVTLRAILTLLFAAA